MEKWYEVCQEIDCELTRVDYYKATSKDGAIVQYLRDYDIESCDKIAVCEVETRRK